MSIGEAGHFRDGLIKYVDDNFGLRAEFVKLDVKLHYWLGVSSIPAMLIGKEGWTFLKTDFDSFNQFRGLNRFTDTGLNTWIDDMEIYRQWLEANGIHFMVVVAPNKETIYPDYMPNYVNRVWPQTRIDQVVQRLKELNSKLDFVDLRSKMWTARSMGLLYYKYENHWNDRGAFVAYLEVMRRLKSQFSSLDPLQWSDFTISPFVRGWNIPPTSEIVPILTRKKASSVVGKDIVMSLPQYHKNFERVSTKLDRAPTVLVYGDSFVFEGLLSPLEESFKWTIMTETNWSPFPVDLIEKFHPNIVIFEMVERYLARPLSLDPRIASDLMINKAPPLDEMLERRISQAGGVVDGVTVAGNQIHFYGWAVDSLGKMPADRVYAYLGNQVVGAASTTAIRNDVTAGMTSHKAGFEMVLSRDLISRSSEKPLRLFSVSPVGRIYEMVINPPLESKIQELIHPGLEISK